MTHYHVNRHSDDEDPYVAESLFDALDYARTELDSLADFEHDYVSTTAQRVEEARTMGAKYPEVYEMEEALLSFAKAERYSNLMANAANMVKQNRTKHADRAPLYQIDWRDKNGGTRRGWDAVKEANARLVDAATRTAHTINEGSPLGIWDCNAALGTGPDTDPLHNGETYCAEEYPDGYAGSVDSDPIGRDEPAGDR